MEILSEPDFLADMTQVYQSRAGQLSGRTWGLTVLGLKLSCCTERIGARTGACGWQG